VQLTMRDVTRVLAVEESTIQRWIKQRGLPAQRVGGQYHFNRAELLEWATAQQIRIAADLFDRPRPGTAPPATVAAALEAGGVFHKLAAADKDAALRVLVDKMPLPAGVDRQQLLQLFVAREALASTAIGDGIAIPHVRSPIVLYVPCPLITLCFLANPVAFGALDGKPVHVLFSLITPTVQTHLQMLSRLSFALHDPRFKEVVVGHGTQEKVLSEIRRIEAGLPVPGATTREAAR
jgi:nitrogen PTS system EIIA component